MIKGFLVCLYFFVKVADYLNLPLCFNHKKSHSALIHDDGKQEWICRKCGREGRDAIPVYKNDYAAVKAGFGR